MDGVSDGGDLLEQPKVERLNDWVAFALPKLHGRLSHIPIQHEDNKNFLQCLMESGVPAPERMSWAEGIVPAPDRVHFPIQVLFVLLMSGNTTDQQCIKEGRKLVNDPRFSLEWINSLSQDELAKIIFKAGKQNVNANYMKQVARILVDEYGGCVPADFDKIRGLPGAGDKMACIVIKTCFDIEIPVSVGESLYGMLFLFSDVVPF
jgi:endonuclease III